MTNNKFSWLHRTGISSNVSKGMEAASKPKSMSKPAGNVSKPAVNSGVQHGASKRPPEAKQPDPAMTAKRVGAKGANINGNDSAKYDKLEKKTTKGLKEGGSEKELRAGHNNIFGKIAGKLSGGVIGGDDKKSSGPSKKQMATPKWQGAHQVGAAKQQLTAAKKSGDTGNIAMAKAGVTAEKATRADLFKQAKSAPKGTGERKAAMKELKSDYAGAWKAKQDAKKKKSSGGGILGKMSGGLF